MPECSLVLSTCWLLITFLKSEKNFFLFFLVYKTGLAEGAKLGKKPLKLLPFENSLFLFSISRNLLSRPRKTEQRTCRRENSPLLFTL